LAYDGGLYRASVGSCECMKRMFIVGGFCVICVVGVYLYRKSPSVQRVLGMAYKRRLRPEKRPEILILTSPGGYGHQAAAAALTEYLQGGYDITSVNFIQEVLGSIDFVHTFTCGQFYSEQFYNYCLVNRYIWLVQAMVWLGLLVFKARYATIRQLVYDYLIKQEPDLIISVMPVINGVVLDVAQELGIPFWVIPTDLDPTVFIQQIDAPTYEYFCFNVPYDLPSLQKQVESASIPDDNITCAGFPVRQQFLADYDRSLLKQVHQVPSDRPVLMLMMGGLGVRDIIAVTKELLEIPVPVHCLICIGKNEELRPKIEKIVATSPLLSCSIIGFTSTIAPFMAMADILITKSGGVSVNEGLYMGVPMIIDGSSRAPQWEYFNRSFVEDSGCGVVLRKKGDLHKVVTRLLSNPDLLDQMKETIQKVPKMNPQLEVCRTVEELLC
jgi:processive 1,2-diacylglycerol beta-glucosyltransferase